MTGSELSAIASGLALWPGLFLVAGGLAKALDLRRNDLRRTVVARLLPDRVPPRGAWAAVAAAELGVGALVLAGLLVPVPEVAAAVLLAGAALVAGWGVRHAPGAPCGCLGARSRTTVSPRTVVRAGSLSALAAIAAVGGEAWTALLHEPWALAAAAAAGAALAWLSPERGQAVTSLRGAAGLRARRLRDAACTHRSIPVDRTVARLRGTEVWRRASPYLAADAPSEHWEEGCWRLMCYPAVYEGESATAVFAVHLGPWQRPRTVAFVNEDEQRVLARLEA
jgi:hypothetical protein